ncbi:LOW QUALITY PROTEIN: 39S ribosomal protein L16, mitochondrial-like [Ctenocephalides felis]|uniref:LOW QUALITY PROTEIN: 39S ribosomal protein L16, mitochondrial-like n=1 Tax=Ctenocephalides felis TaxID=7515 RepID=UPI000E6E228F|nr:LOW QUALITY PROTEIN: 39S ribosomal protein L16, mitochondrial-like [Ctenocephalides felis]
MLKSTLSKIGYLPNFNSIAGLKYFAPPVKYDHIQLPEKPKLKFLEKVPQYAPGLRPPKMQKRLRLMRGPELIHNTLIHKQYGIMALSGGRLRAGHMEMMRLGIGRRIDVDRMFAIWRVDPPWQPVTKKGQGQRMGGGKGAIDHYVTPIKHGRIILEVAGHCEFEEVKRFLTEICQKLPFKAMVVSQEILEAREQKEKRIEEENINPYTLEYIIKNNLAGCHRWISPFDRKWFMKYV